MKLILSRKGFDSAHGGCPSPILDGQLCSLPIPDAGSPTPYGKISLQRLGDRANRRRSDARPSHTRATGAHLDPDLRRDALPRAARWRPIFGQAAAAQSHLATSGDKPGRPVSFLRMLSASRAGRRRIPLRPRRAESSRHLRLAAGRAEIARATDELATEIPWAAGSSASRARPIDTKTTRSISRATGSRLSAIKANGGGTFERLAPSLILSKTDPYVNCSTWRAAAMVRAERAPCPLLSLEGKSLDELRDFDASCSLPIPARSSCSTSSEYPEARGWLRSIFRDANR